MLCILITVWSWSSIFIIKRNVHLWWIILWLLIVCYQTPLQCAAHYGHLEVVKLLVSSGADINAKGDSQVFIEMIITFFIILLIVPQEVSELQLYTWSRSLLFVCVYLSVWYWCTCDIDVGRDDVLCDVWLVMCDLWCTCDDCVNCWIVLWWHISDRRKNC